MSVDGLLSLLEAEGIRLSAQDDRLVVEAPRGRLTEDLRARISERKSDLLLALRLDGDGITRLDRNGALPASSTQRRLWLLQKLDPADYSYNVNLLIGLSGRIDVDRIRGSLEALIDRHEILRSRYEGDGEALAARILDSVPAPLVVRDVADDEQRDALLERAMTLPFDPDDVPLFRVTLLRSTEAAAELLFTFHHMLVDEESVRLLLRDWGDLYDGYPYDAGPSAKTGDLAYHDIAAWQRRRLADGRKRLLDYWQAALGDDHPVLTLGKERPDAPVDRRGLRHELILPQSLARKAATFCAEHGVTPHALLFAAYQRTLHQWSGQADIRVAMPMSDRLRPELADVVGPLMNMVVIRGRIDGAMTGAELVVQARDRVLAAMEHADLPFDELVEALRPERDGSSEPLAQTMFSYLRGSAERVYQLDGLQVTVRDLPEISAKFDLSLFVVADPAGFRLAFQYRPSRLDADTVQRFAEHYRNLLESLVDGAGAPIGRTAALPARQAATLLRIGAGPARPEPFVALGELLSQGVGGAGVALEWSGGRMDGEMLERRSNRLAHWLLARGVGAEARVALLMERSPELVIAILGVLKAGAAYVPLDPEHPPQRLAMMLADAAPALLLTQAHLASGAPAGATAVVLDAEIQVAAGRPEHLPDVRVDGGQLAYLLFTSGSTGRPKAVGVTQAGLLNRLRWMQGRYRLEASDAVLQKTPYGFDVSVWEFLWPLMQGARLVLAGPGEHRDPERLAALIETHGVTTTHFVPAMLQLFLDDLAPGRCSGLRRIVCSGEALSHGLREQALESLPWAELHNLYGPTEASIDVTAWDCRDGREEAVAPPIGRPIDNMRCWVLDGALELAPLGVAGELHLSGVGLARGYQGRPDLTATAFLPNPYGDADPAHRRLYRTGDIARWRADGGLEYLGRADFQVKIRGQRVELGEIEAALTALPQVKEAVAAARGKDAAAWLCAWLSPAPDQTLPDAAALRAALARTLPDHMIPAAFVALERMPLSPNGKIDRKQLPEPQAGVGQDPRQPPASQTEQTLAQLWSELLGVADVSRHDNFFMLGGDSITSLRLASRARALGLHFEPRAIFRHQTIAALAAHAQAGPDADAPVQSIVDPFGQIPLTGIQRWFFEHQAATPHHFNQAMFLTGDEALDPEALRGALGAVAATHPMLTAAFAHKGEAWMQETRPGASLGLEQRRVEGGGSERDRRIDDIVAEVQSSLRLDEGKVFSACLMTLDGDAWRLLLVAHHLVIDGVSWRILLEDLAAAYDAVRSGLEVTLAAEVTPFRAWALGTERRARSLPDASAWEAIAGAEATALPLDRPPPSQGCRAARQRRCSVTLSASECRAMLEQLPAIRMSVETLCLTAWLRTLARWRGTSAVTLHVEGHGRDLLDADVARTVGWFTRLYPVQFDLPHDLDDAAAMRSVRRRLRAAPEAQDPYTLRLQAGAPLIETPLAFNYLGQMTLSAGRFRRAPEPLGHYRADDSLLPWLLELAVALSPEGLNATFQYAAEVFESQTIEALAQSFLRDLRGLVEASRASPSAAITADFPLARLDDDELAVISRSWPLRAVEDIYPLSPIQRGMLLFSGEEGGDHYLSQTVFRCEGRVDLEPFQQALQRTVDRHPVLRTAFAAEDIATPHQVVLRRASLSVRLENLIGHDDAARTTRLERVRAEDRLAITLDQPPLMRCSILRWDEHSVKLVWTIHHLIMDGWSIPLLTREVLEHYAAIKDGRDASLEPAAAYGEFIGWLGARDEDADRAFWIEELGGLQPWRLPGARRSEGLGYHLQTQDLDPEATARLEALCRERSLTLNSVVQGLWGLILSRHAGRVDFALGVTQAGRPVDLAGADRCLGAFINTVPLRMRLEGGGVLGFLIDLQARAAGLREHGHASLGAIQRWSGGDAPLFDTIVVSEQLGRVEGFEITDMRWTRESSVVRNSYPLTLRIVPGEAIRLDFLVDHDRIDPAVVDRMAADLGELLADFHVWIERPLDALFAHLAGQALVDLPPGPSGCALDRLRRHPDDGLAIASAEGDLTYAALKARAAALAGAFAEAGVARGDVVGVLQPRTLAHVEALVASWWLGAAWLALDPALPTERLAWMAADGGARLVAGSGRRPAWLPDGVSWLDLDQAGGAAGPHPAPASVAPDALAYLLYTSGSTGAPKGVRVTHANVMAYVDAVTPVMDLPEAARMATFATVSADLGLTSVLGALLAGGTLVLPPAGILADPPALAAWLAGAPIDMLKIVPGHLSALLDVEQPARLLPRRCLVLGGEAPPPGLLERVRALAPDLRIVNHYGPTETTIGVVAGAIEDVGSGAPALGAVLDHARAYVLDPRLDPVAAGAEGELFIGGHGVAEGYQHRADLTAERFLPDPWRPGARMYRTGDLVRRHPDGRLSFGGRIDDQVKIRGYRVEPREVEQAILAVPGVAATVVLPVQRPSGQALGALVIGVGEAELRAELARRLPDALVPAIVRVVERLPLNANGKLDRATALRLLEASERSAPAQVETPASGAEALFHRLWEELLDYGPAGRDDNFFAQGGDSILCLRLIARAGSAGVKLTTRLVFDNPTPAALAAAVAPPSGGATVREVLRRLWRELLKHDRIQDSDHFFRLGGDSILVLRLIALAGKAGVRLTTRQIFDHPVLADLAASLDGAGPPPATAPAELLAVRGHVAPLLPIQSWFFDQDHPEPDHWNQALMLSVPAVIDADALEDALRAVVEAHPMLRARFPARNAPPVIGALPDRILERLDLVGAADDEDLAARAIDAQQTGLSLSEGPLFRALLLRSHGEGRARLLLVAHHLVVDGVSWRIIGSDLQAAYDAASADRDPAIAPAAVSYGEWCAAVSQAGPALLDRARAYWRPLGDHPQWGVLLPGAAPGTAGDARQIEETIDADLTRRLLEAVPGAQTLLLAALTRSLGEWLGRSDFVIECEGHGRTGLTPERDLSRTVGWFTSRYPLHLRAPAGGGLDSLIAETAARIDAAPNGGVGFGVLRYGRGEDGLPPTPQLAFNYLGQVRTEGGDWTVLANAAGRARSPRSNRSQLIDVTAQVREGRLSLAWRFPAALPQAGFVELVARRFVDHLADLVTAASEASAGKIALIGFGADARLSEEPPVAEAIKVHALSPLQAGMLWHTLAAPDLPVYVNQTAVELCGPLDLDAFCDAWRQTVAAEEILRSGFTVLDELGPAQIVAARAEIAILVVDWRGKPAAQAMADLEALCLADRARGFQLARPPLMRLHLLRRPDDRHWVVWTRHHLIVDAWSSGELLGDVFSRYAAAMNRVAPNIAPRPPFSDHVAWLAEQDPRAADAFWRSYLRGLQPLATLPAGRPGAAFQILDVPTPVLGEPARRLAQRHGVTLNSVVQAAWALALSYRLRVFDVVFGMTMSGRSTETPEAQRILGPFINTLPMRVRLEPTAPLGALLHHVQQQALAVREHEHTPLTRVQQVAGGALFQSLVIFENEGLAGETAAGPFTIRPLTAFERTNYPVALTVMPGRTPKVRVGCDGEIVDLSIAEGLVADFVGILEAMCAPGQTEPALHALFPSSSPEALSAACGADVVGALGSALTEHAGRVALVDAAGELTYAELGFLAQGVARGLRAAGVGREDLVAVHLGRDRMLLASLLGVLLSGAAYVPLDPAQPPARLGDIVEQARPKLAITREPLAGCVAWAPEALIAAGAPAGGEGELWPPSPHPDQRAYVIFTSGSTGRPKGVTVRHGALANLLGSMAERLALGPDDRWLAVTTVGFDIAALELLGPLLRGARVILADEATQRDAGGLMALAEREGANLLQATPATWQMLAQEESPVWPGLRALCGGEALPASLAERLLARGVRLFNVYGPTETTIWSSLAEVTAPFASTSAPLGEALAATGLHVLDDWLRPVPPGGEGELWISGLGLARGYHGRPDLTAAAFIPDPFSATPGARLYRTGDIVRRTPEGALLFVGRRDHQVKLRGHRIELGEIETALLADPWVGAAVAVLHPEGAGSGAWLAAYVTARGDLDPAALRAGLARRLPSYMLPATIDVLAALPLNPNGKVDRKALPKPAGQAAAAPLAEPISSDTERWLAALWADILGRAPQSRSDNFFLLGANSLHATKLVGRIRAKLEVDVPFTLPFSAPTLGGLATALDEAASVAPEMLVELRGGEGPALFVFHPAGGHVRSYGPLVETLAGRGPVYGLQSPQLTQPESAVGGVCGLAELHLRELRQVAPNGPYRLLGWSFGGWLAMEVAARLEAEGAQVEWVGIVDVRADVRAGALNLADLPLATPFITCLDEAMQRRLLAGERGPCHALEAALGATPEPDRMTVALDWFRAEIGAAADRPRDLQLLQMRLFTQCHAMMRDHRLKPVTSPLHVWWASDTLQDKPYRCGAARGEWDAFGPARVRVLEGDHQSIIRSPALAADLDILLTDGNDA